MIEPETLDTFVHEWINEQRSDTLKRMRELTGWGMMECEAYLDKSAFMHDVDNAVSFDELRELIRTLAGAVNWKLR